MKMFLNNLGNKINTSLNSYNFIFILEEAGRVGNEIEKAAEKKIFSEFLKIFERYKFTILKTSFNSI